MTFDYGYEDGVDLTSYVTVRHARYNYDLVDRRTETAGLDRSAYGGRRVASDSQAETSTKANGELKCSDCKLMKEDDQFPFSRVQLNRHAIPVEIKKGYWQLCGRGYRCNGCRQKRYEAEKAEELRLKMESKGQNRKNKKTKKKPKKSKADKVSRLTA